MVSFVGRGRGKLHADSVALEHYENRRCVSAAIHTLVTSRRTLLSVLSAIATLNKKQNSLKKDSPGNRLSQSQEIM